MSRKKILKWRKKVSLEWQLICMCSTIQHFQLAYGAIVMIYNRIICKVSFNSIVKSIIISDPVYANEQIMLILLLFFSQFFIHQQEFVIFNWIQDYFEAIKISFSNLFLGEKSLSNPIIGNLQHWSLLCRLNLFFTLIFPL